ncbi:Nebulin [Lonchura striata]|uniref:Nebulin n=1 Tax=Lonchura striata TaxID=40157 RepID=A0A218UK53_9PASE|nr:Nebulin [Lonchura striata domestica]
MEEEEYEEVVEYYIEEMVIEEGEPHEVVTEITETISTDYSVPETISTDYSVPETTTTTTYTAEHTQPSREDAAPPIRKKTIRTKVDPSKFLTPYLEHSNKMKDLFSENKYKEKFRKEKGKPYASTVDTPEIRRIKKVQDQLSEVKYRMAGEVARTICHVDEKAMDIEHAKKVSQQVSKVLYKQNWEENKDKYLLPPDAPELVNAIKNTALFSKKLYTEDWDADKTLFYPYNDSPELRRVAQAQKTLSDIVYKKGHDERKAKFTTLPDPPDVEQAKKVTRQLSDVIYHEDYKNKIKGKWSQTPCYDVAVAKMNAENLSMRKYQEDFENMKDQIYFMQTETPEYEANKRASENISKFKYRADYEKKKAIADYNVLPATENPLLKQLKTAGNILSDKLYKEAYEQSKGNKMNYCETPKFQTDAALKNFSDIKYKDAYQKNILGHYLGSFEDPHQIHCMKVEAMKSDKNYKADYEEEKTKCYFPQTITQEYEAIKKLEQCKDYTYKKHPDQTKFTSVIDSPVQKQAEINSKQLSDILYKSKGEEIIHKYHLPPDVPQFIQARVNAYNISDANYKADWKKTLAKGYDLKPDAIPIIAAKASRNIASDYKYKESYEKDKGKQVGYRSLQDDPKLVHYMNVAKIQSDREYKKDYEVTKTKYHTPLDMFSVTAAKKAQEVVTNTGYKQPIHHYTLLPDSVNLELSKNVMQLQSDNLYKSDFNNWLRGVGWVPIQSLDVEKAKKATEILSEKKYRQHPDQLKFSIPMDAMEQVLAKQNAKTMNKRLYTDKWNKEKTSIHVMPDTPEILQCKVNQMTMSDKLYKAGWEEDKKKGYDLQPDAIPIKAAKSSRDIASDYKYKLAYEKAKGKHIGFRSLEDDPKLVHFMQVAKMQSDREYKKGYEKAKTNFHTPVDMVSVVAAKKAQEVATNANYKNLIHTYNVLPDAMSIELAKNMMQLQSDNQYKAEYDETMKGVGWLPLGSLEAEKNKKAMEIVSEKKYRQHPDKLKYSVPMDSMNMVLALNNAKIMDEHKYKQAWEEDKKKIHITPDIPQIALAKANAFNLSEKMYRSSFEETRKKGYDLRADAIPVKAAKASRDIASDYKYKLGYEKDKGKLVGFRSLQDDPKLVHCMQVAKMQSDREYKKAYEASKTHYQTPSDTLSVVAAKEAQDRVTNTNYKRLIHQYMLLPDAMSLELYRNMNQIQSDNEYKQDYKEWFRGIGWSPVGSLDVEKSKKATEIASDRKYRQHPSKFPFTKQNDAMDLVLAKQNANIMNKHAYTQAWEKDKTQVHVMPDTPDILQAKQNKTNYSQKLYKLDWEKMIKKGYDLTPEAMSVKAAKASRDIASDFKYKEGYRKQQGHHIGFRSLQDDPKMLWSMQVAKMQSEREYKKDFEKWKTKFNMPVDMLGFLLAKKCQELVSDVDYKHILHRWTCLPDQVDVTEARRVNELQSDNLYKSDLQWLRGIGWSPLGSLEAEKNKKASEILSDKKYRQHPDTIKFTSIPDAMDVVLAKSNAKNRSDILYREAWNKDKTKVHIMPDTPEILLAKSNLINTSDKRYKVGYEELKKKGYDLPPDAIPLQAAKASRDIASEYKYKTAYRKQLGHHIGARNIEDDPKMMWSMHVAKIQNAIPIKSAKASRDIASDVSAQQPLWHMLSNRCHVVVVEFRLYTIGHQLSTFTLKLSVVSVEKLPGDDATGVASNVKQTKIILSAYSFFLQYKYKEGYRKQLGHHIGARNIEDDPKMMWSMHNVYKSDLQWLRGIGWSPIGSLDVEKNKRASEILSDKKYRQHPDTIKFTSLPDSMPMVLAKNNSKIMDQRLYTEAWDKDKTQIHIMPDTPEITLARENKKNYSLKQYRQAMEDAKKKGYDLRADAIPIQAAKASRQIASDRLYTEAWNKDKTTIHVMPDTPEILLAKQNRVNYSEKMYKLALEESKKKGYDLRFDAIPIQSAKASREIASEYKYKEGYRKQLGHHIGARNIEDDPKMMWSMHRLYTEAWNKDKTTIHVMPDTPEILLAKQNRVNYSEKMYKLALEESKKKGYDLRFDAIPIQSAKASREIASEYKYKEGYRKQLGHHIGARNIEDDPKMMWSMHVAKIQSDREYKKDFEKSKTRFSSPVDMLGIVLAKKCQQLVSDADYRHYLHQWICLPDQNDVIHAKEAYDLQSDNCYKSDLEWLRGIGWVPIGSLEVEKAKKAGEILSDRKYRQPADKIKFTSVTDSLAMVLAKQNAEIMNKRLYTEAWDADKKSIHVMPDTPDILLAKANAANVSNKLYVQAWEEAKKKGYDMRADAIPIKTAKASRDIASDYKYKETHEKEKGHYIGCPSAKDDPKLALAARAMALQNDRLYKKAYNDSKTQIHIPVDALSVQAAKECQTLVSDIDYRQYLHQWTCLPDQNDVIHARQAYDLQSDNVYKSDLEWLRGIGWLTEGSVDVVKAKKAQELLSDRLYRTRPEQLKFTSITDSPDVVLAKTNAMQLSDRLYREAWDKDKTQISLPSDTPVMLQSKVNALNISNKHYQKAWDEAKAKSYDIRADAIPIKQAKASRDIASEYKYKETHEKQKGHYIGCPSAKDDPKLALAARAMALQNDRLYKKAYNDSKTQIHIPVDALSVQAAKECQTLVSDIDYRQYLHQWTCLPDQNDVIHARQAYDLQSDAVYRSDLEWLRGIGWLPNDSPEIKRVKNAQDLLSDNVYRTPIDSVKYTSVVDSPDVVLAKINAEQISIPKYKEAWEKDKTMIHIMPDTPEISLAKANAVNYSQKQYKGAWDELKMSYDLRADAIPIKTAKASREIASDYKYKLEHEKQKGHYVGVPNAKGDSKIQFALDVAKVQSEREYKKHFAKQKTQCHLPVDMMSIVAAKHGQALVSDADYRHYLHQWICLPDQNDVIHARQAYDLQSDAVYKADLEWLRGIGWLPNDSLGVKHVKYAGDLLSERKYRTKAETLPFTAVADRVDYVTAKNSTEILSDIKYHKEWNEAKTNYTLTDTPQLDMAREAARILNQNLYKESWEKEKATGYLLPPDTVQITHAKHSSDVQSELKYKAEYVKQRGHYVGVAKMRDDPKLVWYEHAGEIQNDRLYKSNYNKTKSKIHMPSDAMAVVAAKECQNLVSDVEYRQYLHQWTCHPDQNDVIHARQAYDLQSDNVYKADLEWLRGCGWIPLDSVEHKKVKNAQELINKVRENISAVPQLALLSHAQCLRHYFTSLQRAYTKEAMENFSKYTTVVDTPEITLAKMNSVNQSDLKYKETFNQEKGQYIGSDDTPALHHAKDMSLLHSEKHYKKAWELSKPIGYTLDEKYVPLVGAKHANHINSELKYKEIYEKLKGHYLAGKDIGDFPSVTHSLEFQKMRSALAYRKNYEDTKKNVHIPADMMNHVLAKKCQYILSDLEYRTYFHQWSCSPEENDVIHARKAQEILSDSVYKDDLNWLKGLGCYVWDTPQILQAKKSYDLQSQIKYTSAGKENFQNFSVVTDTPVYVTALQSAANASEVKYKEEFHKTKDKYTTVTDTVDSERVQSLKHLYSDNLYKKAWDKVKATSYALPSDTVALARAKELKHNASIVKYREEYDKFKALYTLPRGVEDDPNTERCLRVGKLNIDRLYKEAYEKTKAKVHIVPDMVDIISAKDAQKKVSEVDYRTRLHEWLCLPDLQVNTHVRRVTDQVSDVIYKDDLNWLKGIGCFVWDTPEILHAKQAYDLRSDIKYKSKAEKMKKDFTVVTDTPVYVQNVISALNLSENLYRWAGVNALPTGYSLPTDTPNFQHAKHVQHIGSDLKYKEAYEHMKAKGYTLGPKDVGFENVRKVNQVINERLYRATYHKNKDKIHTTPDTPELRQVRATQEAVSDLIYKSDFFKMQGHLISLPYTPHVLHCRYVGDITSDNKYKEDLRWLKGLGCFLYDTPDMVRARELRKLWSNYIYTSTAKKMWPKFQVVLDTPGYRAVQELKTHLSELVYRAAGNELKTKYTSILDTPDFIRAKTGQKIQSQYLYVELATKERPHHHADGQTQAFAHARNVKDMISEKKYKTQYEKMKHKYTPVPDTPVLIRAKRAYLNASDLRYKETFENTKGKYHTVKDALDIVYHRKVTDDISSVKYKENYMSQLGIWRSIPDRPEHFHHRLVTDAISDVKYKEDLEWLKGTGCYVWDTPSFVLAEQNKVLYSGCKYKENFEKTKSKFKYVADSPINEHFKYATQLMDGKLYKAAYEKLKARYSVIVDDPRNLLAKWGSTLSSQIQYKKDYEKKKDKYTTVLDTPEYLRTTKVNKQISDIIYKLEYNKAKPKGYTTIQDTPMLLHVRKVKDRISDLKYKEMYERSKSRCNVVADSVHIKTPRHAYKLNSNLDYKKKYEAAKAHWHLIADRPDFIQAAKSSLQQSDYEYKLDREFLKGCKLSVTDDKNTVLALNNAILASDIKYKEKHNKARGTYHVVPDTPQILLAKNVSSLVSENKYKEQSKKQLPHGSFTTLPETRDTVHVKEVTKNVSETNYKKKFVKEKGKSNYSVMLEPPEVKHAMEVAKNQSTIEYKKDAKSKLHYTPIADRPDIKKATQAAKLISNIEYKKRGAAGVGVTMLGRPDIELAKEVSKLTSQVKYKENFAKELGKKPKYDLKEAKIYKTLKDAHNMASEVKYKADLKKLHKPVTDMKESLLMNHVLSTSQLASAYQYKKQYEKSKGHYHVVPDNLEQVHLREASELQSHVKYREKYEKEKGKPMLDFETPTYLTAKESQLMQSEKEYKKDFEESMKGRNLTGLEVTPSLLHVKYATKIASEKEYKKALEQEIRGKGLTELALETPDFVRARNATDIASQIKYKQLAEMEKANYTSVVDTPEIIHAQQVKNLSSQKKYKEDAEKNMPYYVPVADTPEMQRVRENQKNFSMLQYQSDLQNSKGKVTVVQDTPEILRVKENQKNFSSVKYKESIGKGTPIPDLPEVKRVKETQKHISSVLYKEELGTGTPTPLTPEMERVKRNQEQISSVLYKEGLGAGTATPVTPEMERVRRNQEHISSVAYREGLGKATPSPITPEMERVKRNQEQISSVLYKEHMAKGTPTPLTPEMERAKRNQENISSVLYSDSFRKQVQGKAAYVLDTPEMRRVRETQKHISTVKYHEDFEKSKGSFTPVVTDPITERVKKNMQDFSDISYRGIQRRVVEMERKRVDQDQENLTVQAQRRSREHSRSASALSISGVADEKSEPSDGTDQRLSYYSNGGFFTTTATVGYKQVKTIELPQQRSSSVATQQTTVSSVPSHPSTAGKTFRAMYDYTAADADEVSFKDGDTIVNVQAIDEGWMYGTVQRTGKTGMLPANYVEAV